MDLKYVIESILFTSQKPLNVREIREILTTAAEKAEEEITRPFRKIKDEQISELLEQLEKEHTESARSYYLACVAGAWQFVARPEFMPWLKTLFGVKTRPPRLSQPALETLAIVAYRQPITRAEVEQIRGVAVDGVVATLLERGLIEQAGRAEVVGRPMTYATTSLFLEYFGLGKLEDLPSADELRRIPVEKPESLLTADQGLATAAPDQLKLESTPPTETAADPNAASPEPAPEPNATEPPASPEPAGNVEAEKPAVEPPL